MPEKRYRGKYIMKGETEREREKEQLRERKELWWKDRKEARKEKRGMTKT